MAQTPVDNIHGLGVVNNTTNTNGKEKKGPDSLFGPNVGVISSGPGWTAQTEKKVLKDELTMDVVKGWIEKSKEVCAILYLSSTLTLCSPRNQQQHSKPSSTSNDPPSVSHPSPTMTTTTSTTLTTASNSNTTAMHQSVVSTSMYSYHQATQMPQEPPTPRAVLPRPPRPLTNPASQRSSYLKQSPTEALGKCSN